MGVEDLQSAPDQDHEADHGDPMGQPGEEAVAIYHHGMRRLNWHRVRAHTRKVVGRIHLGGAHLTSDAGEWARDSTLRVPDYFARAVEARSTRGYSPSQGWPRTRSRGVSRRPRKCSRVQWRGAH